MSIKIDIALFFIKNYYGVKRHIYISKYNKSQLYPDVAAGQSWIRNSVPVDGFWTDEIVIMSEPKHCDNCTEPSVYAMAIPDGDIPSWQFWAGVSVIQKYYRIKHDII